MSQPHYEMVYVDGHEVTVEELSGLVRASCICGQNTIQRTLILAEQEIHRLHEDLKERKNQKVFYALRYPTGPRRQNETFVGLDRPSGGYPYSTDLFHEIHLWNDAQEVDRYRSSFEYLNLERVKVTVLFENDE